MKAIVCCLCQKVIRRQAGAEDRVGVEGPCQDCMAGLRQEELRLEAAIAFTGEHLAGSRAAWSRA